MKLGIVGAGLIVRTLLEFIHELPEIELVAISGLPVDEPTLIRWKEEHGFRYTYLDYSELLANIDARSKKGTIYEVKGYIVSIESQKPQIAIINTSEDGKSRPVYIVNYSKTKWEMGNYYRLFADVYGTFINYPAMNVRYTYTK